MKKDLKNVIITFALVALVFTQASFAYNVKVKNDQILAEKVAELNRVKAEELAKLEQDKILAQIKKDEELQKQKMAEEQLAIQNAKNEDERNKALALQAQAELTRQQAILLAQQQTEATAKAKAQALADAQAKADALALANAKAKTTTTKTTVTPSRQSRAS